MKKIVFFTAIMTSIASCNTPERIELPEGAAVTIVEKSFPRVVKGYVVNGVTKDEAMGMITNVKYACLNDFEGGTVAARAQKANALAAEAYAVELNWRGAMSESSFGSKVKNKVAPVTGCFPKSVTFDIKARGPVQTVVFAGKNNLLAKLIALK